jgi:hypothetical protein
MSVAFSLVGPPGHAHLSHITHPLRTWRSAGCRGVCPAQLRTGSLLYYTAGPFTLPPTTQPSSTTTTTTTIRSICRRCGIGYPRLFFPFFSRWRERDVYMYRCSVLALFWSI